MKALVQLFPAGVQPGLDAVALLLLRIALGGSMAFAHGWGKLTNFEAYSAQFPDPIGLGPVASLGAATFAEFFCAIAVVLGLFTRLATIPLLITMAVAVLVIHSADPFAKKELGTLYFFGFLLLFARGAGPISIDGMFTRRR